MAINVLLVFYFHTSPDSFRKRWWIYCLICYGGPFVIALSLLLVRNPEHGLVYGGATIWCWVDREWDFIRIYTYYMLIWICIVGSILCYFLVGYHVFRTRNRLRSFSTSRNREQKEMETTQAEMAQQGFYGTVTTEVQVVHSAACPSEPKSVHLPRQTASHVSFENANVTELQPSSRNQFFSSVTTSTSTPKEPPPPSIWSRFTSSIHRVTSKFHISDPIKRAYLRTSFLFAVSVLVTWIPSSLNRIHGWLDGGSPYEFHVATAAVLPLQGLWNGIIFFVTSWNSLSAWWRDTFRGEEVIMGERHMSENVAINERPSGPSDGRFDTSDMEDIDSATVGSDVELRRVSNMASKTSSSTL
ncbi:hypothetical protein PT974_12087 [Cladobotryum mycophilum]|uniref:G-protein coupled receptors family 2 profile 2 domain-containing protein n=1 Tax=Cladobotryum mycophilum TaxID=491253 RepID=A0ABR0S8H7_9HYPO